LVISHAEKTARMDHLSMLYRRTTISGAVLPEISTH